MIFISLVLEDRNTLARLESLWQLTCNQCMMNRKSCKSLRVYVFCSLLFLLLILSFLLFRCKRNTLHNIRIFLNVKFYVNNSFKKRIYLNVRVALNKIIKSHIILSLSIKSILNILINLILKDVFKKNILWYVIRFIPDSI